MHNNIIITIGNYGFIVAVHKKNNIENKIFIKKEDFSENTKKEIINLFKKNKNLHTYIIIDTIDQLYKKKSFPKVNFFDLKKLASRFLASEGDKDSFKDFTIINKNSAKNDKQWDCLFISSPQSKEIKEWINFLVDAPNHLAGIYMLPIECFSLFKLIRKNIILKEKKFDTKSNNDLYCIIMQNKVSGVRQVVFSQDSIVFTRIVNYEFHNKDFVEKFEQDIYSTFEYIKRIYNNLKIEEIKVISIFSKEINNLINLGNNKDINYNFFTPSEISKKIGIKSIIPEKSRFCDILISKVFSSQKKIMKFQSPKLKLINKFFLILQSTYYLNLFFVILISLVSFYTIINKQDYNSKIESEVIKKFKAAKSVTSIKIDTLDDLRYKKEGVSLSFERIADFGKIEEALGFFDNNIFKFYSKLSYARNLKLKIRKFSYLLNNFDHKAPSDLSYIYTIQGDVFNNSGDIEDLFREFDALTIETKNKFNNNEVTFSELPKNIDFGQKYYSFPFSFSIIGNNNVAN